MPENTTSILDLIGILEERVKNVHTQSLDLSFNELMDMREADELDISPAYQRLFRWTEGQQSRFIESLLLEMPIPAIYVVEAEEGRYSLIDGLQRISSYLHFRGRLDAPHLDPPVNKGDPLILTDCDIVTELNGKSFDDLGTALQIRVKRAFIRVEVVRKGSDPEFKYHMFKRLNTGGDLLSAQQVRNCTIRMLSPRFNDFIQRLARDPDFIHCITFISDNQRLEAYDHELVLRFFALRNNLAAFKHEVTDFLTTYMEAVSDPKQAQVFDYVREEECFKKTFGLLAKALGEYSFARATQDRSKLAASFGIYHYEAITIGLQSIIDKIDMDNDATIDKLKSELVSIKKDPDFFKMTTQGGKNSPGLLKGRIDFVKTRLESIPWT